MLKGLHHQTSEVECDDSSGGNTVLERLFDLVTPKTVNG